MDLLKTKNKIDLRKEICYDEDSTPIQQNLVIGVIKSLHIAVCKNRLC